MDSNIIPLHQPVNEPQVFNSERFGQLRTLIIDGKLWFVAAEVAIALGYSSAKDMVRSLDDKYRGRRLMPTPSGDQKMTIISESGLWKAIAQRQTGRMVDDERKAFIEAFQDWVFEDVLPQIRANGSYGQPKQLSDTEIVHQALQITARQVEALQAENAILAPKANAWERFCSSVGDMSASEAAKTLARGGCDIGGLHKLYALCDKKREDGGMGWFFRNGHDQREPYQRVVEQGLIRIKTSAIENSRTGETFVSITPRFTAKSLDAIAKHIGTQEMTA